MEVYTYIRFVRYFFFPFGCFIHRCHLFFLLNLQGVYYYHHPHVIICDGTKNREVKQLSQGHQTHGERGWDEDADAPTPEPFSPSLCLGASPTVLHLWETLQRSIPCIRTIPALPL